MDVTGQALLEAPDPWAARPPVPVPSPGQPIREWGLAIDAPLVLANPDAHDWVETADLVVVGLGGAGGAAAPDGAERRASRLRPDHH